MSDQPKDGGPAFPTDISMPTFKEEGGVLTETGQFRFHHPGMTLREYYAGQALAGLLAGCVGNTDAAPAFLKSASNRSVDVNNIIAAMAGEVADAMLAEQEKKQ